MDEDFVLWVSVQYLFDMIARLLEVLDNVLSWDVKQLQDLVVEVILEAWIDLRGCCKYVGDSRLLQCFLVICGSDATLVIAGLRIFMRDTFGDFVFLW